MLTGEPVELLPQTLHTNPPPVTPLIAAWAAAMLLAPHQLTDPAFVVPALAYAAIFARGLLICNFLAP